MQAMAWAHASPSVTALIPMLITMSDYRQTCLELPLRARLTLADAIVLFHRLGVMNAVRFISVVDPWCLPGQKTRAPCLVKRFVQSAVDKATVGKRFNEWTAESMTPYLMSPLLVLAEERPVLIRVPKTAAGTSCGSFSPNMAVAGRSNVLPIEFHPMETEGNPPPPQTRLILDSGPSEGAAEGAAETSPTPAQSPRPRISPLVPSSPTPLNHPLFSPGSVVRVLPDTNPGVRPMHAEGMLMTRVSGNAGDGYYFITPTSIKKETPGVGRLARC